MNVGENDCEPGGAERRSDGVGPCLFIDTRWVKVPVQFLALAVVARSGPRRSASEVFRQVLGLGLFGENDLQTGVTWQAHFADQPE
jgi:hypothetical protein